MILNRKNTAIVTDSTADLPEHMLADPNLSMVPLTVFFGEDSYLDWVELTPAAFYERLTTAAQLPRTSQPSPGAFLECFKNLRKRYERIYSVHLSAKLSGTCSSAAVAAGEIDGVTVVDSELATGGIALLVDRLLARLDEGTSEEEFDAYIRRFLNEKMFYFLPATLDYLYKGGRIGRASHLVGTLLNIRPVLVIEGGEVDVYRKARGTKQALDVMVTAMIEHTKPELTTYVSLSHAINPSLVEQLRGRIAGVPDRKIEIRLTSLVGSVIGTYIGPGAVGIGFIQE